MFETICGVSRGVLGFILEVFEDDFDRKTIQKLCKRPKNTFKVYLAYIALNSLFNDQGVSLTTLAFHAISLNVYGFENAMASLDLSWT